MAAETCSSVPASSGTSDGSGENKCRGCSQSEKDHIGLCGKGNISSRYWTAWGTKLANFRTCSGKSEAISRGDPIHACNQWRESWRFPRNSFLLGGGSWPSRGTWLVLRRHYRLQRSAMMAASSKWLGRFSAVANVRLVTSNYFVFGGASWPL